jgi:hypothetical protein
MLLAPPQILFKLRHWLGRVARIGRAHVDRIVRVGAVFGHAARPDVRG